MRDGSQTTRRDVHLRMQNSALVELSLSRTRELGTVAEAQREIVEAAARVLGVQRVGIWMFNDDFSRMSCVSLLDAGRREECSDVELNATDYPSYFAALSENRCIAVEDACNDPRTNEFRDHYLEPRGIASMLDAPVRVGGRMVGVVCHEHVGRPRCWTQDEQTFAGSIADFVSLSVLAGRRKVAEQAVEHQRAFLRQVIDLNPNLIFAKDAEGRFTLVNQATADFCNTTVEELIGKTDVSMVPIPEELEACRHTDQRVLDASVDQYNSQETLTDSRGQRHCLQTTKRPIRGPDGQLMVLGVCVDITERVQSQERQAIMVRELDHRVKINLFAVQAIANQTAAASESLEDFLPSFSGRIHSLAVAHEVLAQAHWEGAELSQMLTRLTETYRRQNPNRFRFHGEPIVLSPSTAPSLSMILHELATNAVKYGSLSVPEGYVDVDWTRHDNWLRLEWRERGGPPVRKPMRRGFGTELVERQAAYELGGSAHVQFDDPSGVVCRIEIPINQHRSA